MLNQTESRHLPTPAALWPAALMPFGYAGGDGDRDAGPARQPECPDSPGKPSLTHVPVMPQEVLSLLAPERGGHFVDATVGLGGHAELMLEASPEVKLLGIDRDAEALEIAGKRLERFADRVTLVHDDHRNLPQILAQRGLGASGTLSGVLADFGMSSWQLEAPGRGFSFRRDEPLDMRMDRSTGRTAADLLAEEPEHEIARIIYEYGEERRSRPIARAIVRRRDTEPVTTTAELANLVTRVIRQRQRGMRIHPATRTFQALRIAVNCELEGMERFLLDSVEALQARGRLILLSFHSLEDRLVKTSLHQLSHLCSCPRSLPRCACSSPNRVALLTRKPLRPRADEIAANPRARSAKLRAAERL